MKMSFPPNIRPDLWFTPSIIDGHLSVDRTFSPGDLTVSIKHSSGNDPSANQPVKILFRNNTLTSGDITVITLTAATYLVIKDGSTLGAALKDSGFYNTRVWVTGINDNGTFRLGVMNTETFPLRDGLKLLWNNEGGATPGTADSAKVLYSNSVPLAEKPVTILGYFEYDNVNGFGTWTQDHTKVQLYKYGMNLPGEIVQKTITSNGSVSTGTATIPHDDTLPQVTEGTEFITHSFTPISRCNYLLVDCVLNCYMSVDGNCTAALFVNTETNARACGSRRLNTEIGQIHIKCRLDASLGNYTFKVRIGGSTASTITFNGASGNGRFNGTFYSSIAVEEINA